MRALLNVNVWIALLDANHIFAERANAWFARERPAFATCPIVENGVVRIIASPGYSTLTAADRRRQRDAGRRVREERP